MLPTAEFEFGGHTEHAEAPDAANVPAAQSLHADKVHDEAPTSTAGENLPAAQLVQTSPAAANLPAAQMVQSLSSSDPAGEDLPTPQLVHTVDDQAPVVDENVPAAQLVQTPPAAANLPAAQLEQSLPASDPAVEDLPAGHCSLSLAPPTQ